MTRVLIVEDDEDIADPLQRVLLREGYAVRVVRTGAEALNSCGGADVVVLDLGLPDLDGLDVCRAMREAGLQTPVLVLSARAQEADVIVGLDAGADDYLTKPPVIGQLLARLRALLRRTVPASVLRVGPLEINRDERQAVLRCNEGHRRRLATTPTEFALLCALAERAEMVVSREQLLTGVWGTVWPGADKTLDVHISGLRRKIGQVSGDPCSLRHTQPWHIHPPVIAIVTIRGSGYRLTVPSQSAALDDGPAMRDDDGPDGGSRGTG